VEKHRVEYGQLSAFKDKQGCSMIEAALMMDDAREIGMPVVCSWFEEDEATGILKLGMVHNFLQSRPPRGGRLKRRTKRIFASCRKESCFHLLP